MKKNFNSPQPPKPKYKIPIKPAIPPVAQAIPVISIHRYKIYGILMALAFILYANTIQYGYALDDGIVITKNEFTKQGLKGIKDILAYDTMAGEHGKDVNFVAGGRYRPFSLVMFAIEYQFLGESPKFSHFINVLMYGFTCVLLFMILSKLLVDIKFAPYQGRWYLSLAFLVSLLYATHPIHTEVVANIKGRDEIMTLLGALGALWFTIKYHEKQNFIYLILSFIAFFLGLMSKENAITFVAIIPLAIHFFTSSSLKKNLLSALPLILASLLFIIIRHQVIGGGATGTVHELMNNPFVDPTNPRQDIGNGTKYATIFLTLLYYIKLLIFPHPLTWDYYPYHIPLVDWIDIRAVFALLLYAGLIIYAVLNIKKKNHLNSFSIWVFLASLSIVSNIPFSIGTFMSERFVYISSIGFLLILIYYLTLIWPQKLMVSMARKGTPINSDKIEKGLLIVLTTILLLYSVKTITRNTVWKNNLTLFTTDVLVSKNSAKGLTCAGEQLVLAAMPEKDSLKRKQDFELSIIYLRKAIEIHPRYIAPYLDLGIVYEKYKKNWDSAVWCYMQTVILNPTYEKGFNNIAVLFSQNNINNIDFQFKTYEKLYEINQNRYDINYTLGAIWGVFKKNLPKSIFFLEKALLLEPNNIKALTDLGVACGMSNNFSKAAVNFEKALAIDPNDLLLLQNLMETYRLSGFQEKAKLIEARIPAAKILNEERLKKQQEELKKRPKNQVVDK